MNFNIQLRQFIIVLWLFSVPILFN